MCIVSCSKTSTDAIENYTQNKTQLLELKNYFSRITPKDYSIQLRLKSNNKLSLFVRQNNYWDKDSWKVNEEFDEYGVIDITDKDISDPKVQNVFSLFGWTSSNIDSLKYYFQKLNTDFICSKHNQSDNSLKERKFISISFPTNELYSLDYYFLDTCLTNEEFKKAKQDCSYEVIDSCTLIKYTGTSWMSDCMPEKRN
jgi:hypothetical protein